MSGEEICGGSLCDTVRKGEFEVFGEELLDVGALDIIGFLDFHDFEDLK